MDPNQLAQVLQQGQGQQSAPQAPSQGGQPSVQEIHQVYQKLNEVLMNLHAMGIPGMDKVLAALNAQHVDQIAPQAQAGATPPRMPGQ